MIDCDGFSFFASRWEDEILMRFCTWIEMRDFARSSYIYIFLVISSSKESTRKENKILGRLGETEGGNRGREKKARASNEHCPRTMKDNEGITPRPDDFKILLLNTDR